MKNLVNVLLVAVLTGIVAQYLGWIAVPVVALIVSLGTRELKLRAWQVGAGAALSWAIMIAVSARSSAFSGLLGTLGNVFQLPGFALLFVALLLPFSLGWSTSAIASAVIERNDT